jgi:hypothetical protein
MLGPLVEVLSEAMVKGVVSVWRSYAVRVGDGEGFQHRRRGSAAKSSSSRLNRLYYVYLAITIVLFKLAVLKVRTENTQLFVLRIPYYRLFS